jgi:hypothetical protein
MLTLAMWLTVAGAGAGEGFLALADGGMTLRGPTGDAVSLPCAARQTLVVDGVVWVACADAVVRVPMDAEQRLGLPFYEPAGGQVHHLEVRGGVVVPVLGDPGVPAAPLAVPAVPIAAPVGAMREGTITGVDGKLGVVDVGQGEGFVTGRFVEVVRDVPVTMLEQEITEQQLVGYGEIQASSDDQSIIRMAVNQFPVEGATVRVLPRRPASYSLGPPRIGGQGFFDVNLRGVLGAGFSSGALSADAGIGYRMKIPMSFELRFDPLVLGGDSGGGFGHSAITAVVSLDHQWFAIGGGGGVSMTDEGDVFGVWQHKLRFGPIDGLNFVAWIGLRGVPYDFGFGRDVYWEVDQIRGTWQIPVAVKPLAMWIIVRGRGGYLGGGGEAGIRIRAHGNGERGSWALTPLVGGETWQEYDGSSTAGGPTIGIGFDAVY